MNTIQKITHFSDSDETFTWLSEKQHDLASWLDEIDLELHEQLVCGSEAPEPGDL